MRRTPWIQLSVGYFLLSLLALIWPIFPAVGNAVHPRVLGLPWSLVYVLGIVVLNAAVLAALHRSGIVDARELDPDRDRDGGSAS